VRKRRRTSPQWLNGIGLEQYEALFREHQVDADVLVDPTEADLEKIGVPLGRRKRLMRAIAGLSGAGLTSCEDSEPDHVLSIPDCKWSLRPNGALVNDTPEHNLQRTIWNYYAPRRDRRAPTCSARTE
jgi:SAM domain (Sterile alpha motif)